ncbi:BTB/POZ domain-containing protein 6-B-like [Alosa sapidissima]|uniref:BTB/POZ domain-containing protein 6-B-like n=1 Tax=Alosa sapidissima TaxID=34773 RepID=UPI001C0907D9|nr:BTB/POZ domain-containing protein 6-B-like [Alosa sapidissima]
MKQREKNPLQVGIIPPDGYIFMLLFKFLQETLKKSKRAGKHSGKLSVCYEILTLSLKKKMAAELFSAKSHTNLQSAGTTAVSPSEENSLGSVTQPLSPATTPTTQQNILNNNTEKPAVSAAHPTLRERNASMFNNELMADVHFIVGPPGDTLRIPAHKYVLAVGSSVFCAMFYSDLAETDSEIHIPDVEPAAFLILLRYLYSDEIELTPDTVLATLYAAKKYLVGALSRACVAFLETGLEAGNACVLLSQSVLFEEPGLSQRCWEMIDAQAELALQSEAFCQMDPPTLDRLLRRETLSAREASVFSAVGRWAEAECVRRGLSVCARNKRSVLGPALALLRVASLSLQEFADGPAQSDLLTLEETNQMFLWYTAANKPHPPFPSSPRRGLRPQRCHRFQSAAYRSNQWRYRGRCDSIQFSADRRLFLAGVGLYGSSGAAAEYGVRMELKRQGASLALTHTRFTSDGSSAAFPVLLEHPVLVEPDVFYTVSVVLEGTELSYFGQEGLTEAQSGNVTFQFQCSADSTNGTGVQGGQIPELVFYA